ncbi:putative lipid II flippase FtsW [bioreactor metagenome]|uniref:Putative lipid II flippase FtsW n=1 Tax=bioreactor metagenome TaxID=1076179 RepID=A0A645GEG1_9ZZZZ
MAAAIHQIALNAKSEKGFLLVTGINFLVVGQAVANMAMVCGILPVIGVPLSFISYGGTALIVNLAAIGIVIAVYQDEVKQETSQQEVAAVFEKRKQELVGKRSVPRRWQR